ncbi:MAG: ubiquinol-cytochrome c reductase iron-sulfur subunit [Acidobacteriota bacterium]
MARKFLPVLDRRLVLRGIAASVVGALAGCRLALDDGTIEPGVDAGQGSPATGGGSGSGSAAGSGSGGMVQCTGGYCLDLADPANAALRSVGGARVILIGNAHVIVVHVSDGEFVALSAVCTHAGCLVGYASAANDLLCPCHGSQFALDGTVLRGPAATPLATYPTTFDASTDVVTIAVTAQA